MNINRLKKHTKSKIRSDLIVHNISNCVLELVENSVDANATCIAVRINLTTFKLQIVDNGIGLTKEQLQLIGNKYCTTKCKNISNLETNLKYFGYRGKTLASIKNASYRLIIISRAAGTNTTYCKIFQGFDSPKTVKAAHQRASKGTTIIVDNILGKIPVRQKCIIPSLEIQNIKQYIQALSLMYPSVIFSVRDNNLNREILKIERTNSTTKTFTNLFPDVVKNPASMVKVVSEIENVKIKAMICKGVIDTSQLQFVFVNKRYVVKSEIQKYLIKLLSRSFHVRGVSKEQKNAYFESPVIKSRKNAIFIVNVCCPLDEYEINLEPNKRRVQFKNWNKISACLNKLVDTFLQQDTSSTIKNISNDNRNDGTTKRSKFVPKRVFDKLNNARTLRGLPAHREKCLPGGSNDVDEIRYGNNDDLISPGRKSCKLQLHRGSQSENTELEFNEIQRVQIFNRFTPATAFIAPLSEKPILSTVDLIYRETKSIRRTGKRTIVGKVSIDAFGRPAREIEKYDYYHLAPSKDNRVFNNFKFPISYKIPSRIKHCSKEIFSLNNRKLKKFFHSTNDKKCDDANTATAKSISNIYENSSNDRRLFVTQNKGKPTRKMGGQTKTRLERGKEKNYAKSKIHRTIATIDDKNVENEAEFYEKVNPEIKFGNGNTSKTVNEARINPLENLSRNSGIFVRQTTADFDSNEKNLNISNWLFETNKTRTDFTFVSEFNAEQPLFNVCYSNEDKTNSRPNDINFNKFGTCGNVSSNRDPLRNVATNTRRDVVNLGIETNFSTRTENCFCSCHNLCENLNNARLNQYENDRTPDRQFSFAQNSRYDRKNVYDNVTSIRSISVQINPFNSCFKIDVNKQHRYNLVDRTENVFVGEQNFNDDESHIFNVDNNSKGNCKEIRGCSLVQTRNVHDHQTNIDNFSAQNFNSGFEKNVSTDTRVAYATDTNCAPNLPSTSTTSAYFQKSERSLIEKMKFKKKSKFLECIPVTDIPKGMMKMPAQRSKVMKLSESEKRNLLDFVKPYSMKNHITIDDEGNSCLKIFPHLKTVENSDSEDILADINCSLVFTKSDLSSLMFLAQIDKKFFLAYVLLNDTKERIIVALDQHAVDERIRVEQLLKSYIDENGKWLSVSINPPIYFNSSVSNLSFIVDFEHQLQDLGLYFNFLKQKSNELLVTVIRVPLCIFKRAQREKQKTDFTLYLKNLIESLIRELIEKIYKAQDSRTANIPEIFQTVINYEACKGAIKFGDELSSDICVTMLKKLAICNLPFQCAHGRPLMAPLVNLTKLENIEKQIPKHSLQNITNVYGHCEKDWYFNFYPG